MDLVYWNKEGITIYKKTEPKNSIDPYYTELLIVYVIFYKQQYIGCSITFEEAYEKAKERTR